MRTLIATGQPLRTDSIRDGALPDRTRRSVSRTALPAGEAYRLWADTYDAENAVSLLEQQCVQRLTPRLQGAALLDAACGTGRRLPREGGRGARCVVGIDLVFEMIRQAAVPDITATVKDPLGRHTRLAVGDVRALPCVFNRFDIVWCRLAVGHVPELERVYAELTRVARAGARIIVTDFHPAAARAGHVRTFRDALGELHTVEHHIHELDAHVLAAGQAGLALDEVAEPAVGRVVRGFYEAAGRLDVYKQQRGLPLVLALAFRA